MVKCIFIPGTLFSQKKNEILLFAIHKWNLRALCQVKYVRQKTDIV